MSDMAEVIEEHIYAVVRPKNDISCYCGQQYRHIKDHAKHVADALTEAGYGKLADAFPIIRDLADPEDCWFDHHGGCQSHGYLSLEPDETCPQHDAKEWLKANEGSAS